MEKKGELASNQFYFLINPSGHYLKTSSKKDFDSVSKWGPMLFSGIIKNSDYFFYRLGSVWHKKKFSQFPVSKPQSKTVWFDVYNLDLKNCNHISQVKIQKSKDMEEEYESL